MDIHLVGEMAAQEVSVAFHVVVYLAEREIFQATARLVSEIVVEVMILRINKVSVEAAGVGASLAITLISPLTEAAEVVFLLHSNA